MDPNVINSKDPKTWKWGGGAEKVRVRQGGPSWLFQALRMKEAAASLLMGAVSNRGMGQASILPEGL